MPSRTGERQDNPTPTAKREGESAEPLTDEQSSQTTGITKNGQDNRKRKVPGDSWKCGSRRSSGSYDRRGVFAVGLLIVILIAPIALVLLFDVNQPVSPNPLQAVSRSSFFSKIQPPLSSAELQGQALWVNHVVKGNGELLIAETFESRLNAEVAPLLENHIGKIWDSKLSGPLHCHSGEKEILAFSITKSGSLPASISILRPCQDKTRAHLCTVKRYIIDVRDLVISLPSHSSRFTYAVQIIEDRGSPILADELGVPRRVKPLGSISGAFQVELSDVSRLALQRYCGTGRHNFETDLLTETVTATNTRLLPVYELKRLYGLLAGKENSETTHITWDSLQLSKVTINPIDHSPHSLTLPHFHHLFGKTHHKMSEFGREIRSRNRKEGGHIDGNEYGPVSAAEMDALSGRSNDSKDRSKETVSDDEPFSNDRFQGRDGPAGDRFQKEGVEWDRRRSRLHAGENIGRTVASRNFHRNEEDGEEQKRDDKDDKSGPRSNFRYNSEGEATDLDSNHAVHSSRRRKKTKRESNKFSHGQSKSKNNEDDEENWDLDKEIVATRDDEGALSSISKNGKRNRFNDNSHRKPYKGKSAEDVGSGESIPDEGQRNMHIKGDEEAGTGDKEEALMSEFAASRGRHQENGLFEEFRSVPSEESSTKDTPLGTDILTTEKHKKSLSTNPLSGASVPFHAFGQQGKPTSLQREERQLDYNGKSSDVIQKGVTSTAISDFLPKEPSLPTQGYNAQTRDRRLNMPGKSSARNGNENRRNDGFGKEVNTYGQTTVNSNGMRSGIASRNQKGSISQRDESFPSVSNTNGLFHDRNDATAGIPNGPAGTATASQPTVLMPPPIRGITSESRNLWSALPNVPIAAPSTQQAASMSGASFNFPSTSAAQGDVSRGVFGVPPTSKYAAVVPTPSVPMPILKTGKPGDILTKELSPVHQVGRVGMSGTIRFE